MNKRILILGAGGLVGSQLVQLALNNASIKEIILPVRRLIKDLNHDKIKQFIVDFDRLHEYPDIFNCTSVFCCLGTTIKKAGSQEEFKKPDFVYPLSAAKMAKDAGAAEYNLVSALGADSTSKIFYNKVKGETEDAIRAVQFKTFNVYRPSLLLGDRSERRTGELISAKIYSIAPFLFSGPLKKYEPIHAKVLANFMLNASLSNLSGNNIYESNEMNKKS